MLPVFERNKTLKKFILKRIYTAFIVVLFVVALNFFIIKLAPGDPVNIMAGFDNPSEEFKMAIRAKYNLDKPLITQFFTYIYRMGASLLLSGTSAILAFVIGTLLGLAAGKKENRWQDKVLSAGTYVANAMPSFWLGMMLIFVFASHLGWLPTQGMYTLRENYTGLAKYIDLGKHLILPVTTLVIVQIPGYFRITKSSVIQVMTDDYVTTFRVTGMSEQKIFTKYVLKNAILPVITLFGINLAYIVAGSTLVETIFSWQGIGILMYTAISKRDYNVLMGTYLIIAVSVAVFMILVDLIYAKLDPRIHYD